MMSRGAFGKSATIGPAQPLAMFLTLLSILTSPAKAQIATNGGASQLQHEANLPVIFLEAKEEIPADRRVPCTVRIAYPKGFEAGATNQWSGVVRIHGGVSKSLAKKSFAVSLDQPAR